MADGELAVALFLQGVVCWGVAGRFLGDDIGLEFLLGDDVLASVKSEVIFDASNKAYNIWIVNTKLIIIIFLTYYINKRVIKFKFVHLCKNFI